MKISTFDSEAFCGYTQKTTFWQDFSIADAFGLSAIKDTYNRAFKSWKTNTEYITEFVMVLNWKCWQWYERGNQTYSELYGKLFYEARDWCFDNLKGDDLTYFVRTTD